MRLEGSFPKTLYYQGHNLQRLLSLHFVRTKNTGMSKHKHRFTNTDTEKDTDIEIDTGTEQTQTQV